MTYLAVKVPVIESERGWDCKIDDHMVCLSIEDAYEFIKEFNAQNTEIRTPDWYMQAEDVPETITLSEAQYQIVLAEKRVWLNGLKLIP